MGAGEIIAIVAITLIIGGAVFYIVKAKKSGRKCIGCPDGCSCSGKKKDCNGECSSCHKEE
jgi:hypothetical protein